MRINDPPPILEFKSYPWSPNILIKLINIVLVLVLDKQQDSTYPRDLSIQPGAPGAERI